MPSPSPRSPERIRILAGVNGAGKSSLLGAQLRALGAPYFNPDDATRELCVQKPELSLDEANQLAWRIGCDFLARAIDEGESFTLETTLGGGTITRMLDEGARAGTPVEVHYVGLDSVERHIARVAARVARGGHDISEAKIRERYIKSRLHLIELLPNLDRLVLYDNSVERDPFTNQAPTPVRLFEVARRTINYFVPPDEIPEWARPIAAAAMKLPLRGVGFITPPPRP